MGATTEWKTVHRLEDAIGCNRSTVRQLLIANTQVEHNPVPNLDVIGTCIEIALSILSEQHRILLRSHPQRRAR